MINGNLFSLKIHSKKNDLKKKEKKRERRRNSNPKVRI